MNSICNDFSGVIEAGTPTEDTVLDTKYDGTYIQLPCKVKVLNKTVDKIFIPPLEHRESFVMPDGSIVLHAISRRLDNLVRCIEARLSRYDIQKSVNRLMLDLCDVVAGKSGVANRHIVGCRLPNSGRAVCIPDTSIHFGEIGIPWEMARRAKIDDGDIVLFGRQPTLWYKSIQSAVANVKRHYVKWALRLHPLYCKGLNADFDGDTIHVWKPPQELSEEFKKLDVWDLSRREDHFISDFGDLELDGLSVYTDDIDKVVSSRISEIDGKSITLDDLNLKPMSKEEVQAKTKHAQSGHYTVKLCMGSAGMFQSNLNSIFSGGDKELIRAAQEISERVSQTTLSSKHGHDTRLFDVIEMFDNVHLIDKEEIVDMLVDEFLLDKHRVESVVDKLKSFNKGLRDSAMTHRYFKLIQGCGCLGLLALGEPGCNDIVTNTVKEAMK